MFAWFISLSIFFPFFSALFLSLRNHFLSLAPSKGLSTLLLSFCSSFWFRVCESYLFSSCSFWSSILPSSRKISNLEDGYVCIDLISKDHSFQSLFFFFWYWLPSSLGWVLISCFSDFFFCMCVCNSHLTVDLFKKNHS